LNFLVDELCKSSKVYAAHCHASPSSAFSSSPSFPIELSSIMLAPPCSFGARLTGGGWGGSCFALTDNSFTERDAQLVALAYDKNFKHQCKHFNVSAAQGACILQI